MRILDAFPRVCSSRLIFRKDLKNDNGLSRARLDIDIGLLGDEDIEYFSSQNGAGRDISEKLRSADLSFIARHKGEVVHRTCVALTSPSFTLNREEITISKGQAYIYGVYTLEGHRGYGVAESVFSHIHRELRQRSVQSVFSSVWSGNIGSRRLFLKAGYAVSGRLSLVRMGKNYFSIVRSGYPYFQQQPIFEMSPLRIYRTDSSGFNRIGSELKPLVEKWRSSRYKVAVFGAGGNFSSLFNAACFPTRSIGLIVDNDPMKQNREFKPLGLTIKPPSVLNQTRPDVIIVTSEAFQKEIAEQIA